MVALRAPCHVDRHNQRLSPLYKYTSTRETGEAEFSFLWPLVDYRSKQGTVTSASLLWWLASLRASGYGPFRLPCPRSLEDGPSPAHDLSERISL